MIALVFVVSLTAAAVLILGGAGPRDGNAPTNAEQIVGVVTHVDSSGLTNVSGFSLRSADGAVLAFSLAQLGNGAEFPPGHLEEHQASASPIRVWFTTEGGVNYAIRLEDAGQTG